jgi:hypothetical protein
MGALLHLSGAHWNDYERTKAMRSSVAVYLSISLHESLALACLADSASVFISAFFSLKTVYPIFVIIARYAGRTPDAPDPSGI